MATTSPRPMKMAGITNGTIESVNAIAVDDIRAFVKRRFGRDNLVIGVVGDITAVDLGAILDETFGSLPAKAASWAVPEVKPRTEGKTVVIAKPVPQSSMIIAQRGDPHRRFRNGIQ